MAANAPSMVPTQIPTFAPSISMTPTSAPTVVPTYSPTVLPTATPIPSAKPSVSFRPTYPADPIKNVIQLAPGAIVGIIVSGISFIALTLTVAYFVCRRVVRPRTVHLRPTTVYWRVDKDGKALPDTATDPQSQLLVGAGNNNGAGGDAGGRSI